MLASASFDKTVRLWDWMTGEEKTTFQVDVQDGFASVLAFAPEGNTLAFLTSDMVIALWDLRKVQRTALLLGPAGRIMDIAFSPDGTLLASGGEDQTITLWEVATCKPQTTLRNERGLTKGCICSLRFNSDGKLLASGDFGGTIKLWSVHDGQRLATLQGHDGEFTQVVFNPTRHMLASASVQDNNVKLWRIRRDVARNIGTGQATGLSSIAFSPDGHMLASSSFDGTITLWRLAPMPSWPFANCR